MIAAGLLALAAALPVNGGDGPNTWREVAPVPPEGAPENSARLDHPRGVERALSAIVLENGDRARLWTYGVSGEGRSLLALELHAERLREGWRAGEGPTIVVVADLERDAAAGARDVLDSARRLVVDDAALGRARWLIVPAPAPDRLAGHEPDVALAWDFPFGWDAWNTPRAGAYPLRAPETRALAAGLSAWGTGTALVVLGAAERRGGASLETYARALGWEVLGSPDAGEGVLRSACALLPQLELEPLCVRRATAELWEVEVRIRAESSARVGDVRLEVGGVQLLAAARRSGADALPLPVDTGAGTVTLAAELPEEELGEEPGEEPGEEILRLLVRGSELDRVRVRLGGRGAAPRVAELPLLEKAALGGD